MLERILSRICKEILQLYRTQIFFFKQKTAYELMPSLVGSEMCIRDRSASHLRLVEAFRLRDDTTARRELERLIENGRQQILEFTARNPRR